MEAGRGEGRWRYFVNLFLFLRLCGAYYFPELMLCCLEVCMGVGVGVVVDVDGYDQISNNYICGYYMRYCLFY